MVNQKDQKIEALFFQIGIFNSSSDLSKEFCSSYKLLRDGCFNESCSLDRLRWIRERLGRKTGNKLIGSLNRCHESDVVVQVSHSVIVVHFQSSTLSIVEPELNLSHRLAGIDCGLSSSSAEVDCPAGRLGRAAHTGTLSRERDVLGRGWRHILLSALVLEPDR